MQTRLLALCSRQLALHTIELRWRGCSNEQIACVLKGEDIPTPTGGSRRLKSYANRLLHTRDVQGIMAELTSADATC